MVIISRAVDDADPFAAANGANAPRQPAGDFVGAGTTPLRSSHPPNYVASTTATSSGAYASSSFPPPPQPKLQSHGGDLACYNGSMLDTFFFPQVPPSMAGLSYFDFPQLQGFPPCFTAPFSLEPAATTIRPELQLPATMTQPARVPPSSLYPQTQGTTTAPALADAQLQAQEDDTRPAPRRRGRPSKRAPAVSEPPVRPKPTKRVTVGSKRAASTSQMTSSAATGLATMSSSARQVPVQRPDQAAGASSSSTGSTNSRRTAACTGTNDSPMAAALLCEERCQLQRPAAFNNGAPAGVVVEGHHQQAAAIAPPELMTTGPPYADTSAVGVRFHPTDQQLIDYLRMKYARQQMPVDIFKEFDVYQAHPMAIKGACGESQNGCWYAFSPRGRKYRNGKRPARSVFAEGGGEQVGFWKSNSKLGEVREGGRKDGAVIGRMTSLTFQLGRQPKGKQTGWKMKEYTIPENQHHPDGSAMLLNDWVACKLFYKERPTCTKAKSKTDDNAISVGQKRPRRSRKSKKGNKNAIPVAVGQEEDGPGEAAGKSVQGEEDMQQMVPAAAHQASNYSEPQDLCVQDYLVCDVAFAQQNDAANCTI